MVVFGLFCLLVNCCIFLKPEAYDMLEATFAASNPVDPSTKIPSVKIAEHGFSFEQIYAIVPSFFDTVSREMGMSLPLPIPMLPPNVANQADPPTMPLNVANPVLSPNVANPVLSLNVANPVLSLNMDNFPTVPQNVNELMSMHGSATSSTTITDWLDLDPSIVTDLVQELI